MNGWILSRRYLIVFFLKLHLLFKLRNPEQSQVASGEDGLMGKEKKEMELCVKDKDSGNASLNVIALTEVFSTPFSLKVSTKFADLINCISILCPNTGDIPSLSQFKFHQMRVAVQAWLNTVCRISKYADKQSSFLIREVSHSYPNIKLNKPIISIHKQHW